MKIPKVNENYNYFDDGKISPSRKDEVTITEVVEFNKIDKETLKDWEQEVKDYHWLYKKTTDYFIKGKLKDAEEDVVFVRTIKNNGWFSLGWLAGRLDIDGSLTERLNEAFKEDI